MKQTIFLYLFVFFLTACNKSNNSLSQDKELIGKAFEFPKDAMYIVQGDSVLYDPLVNDFNIVVYVNSLEYTECKRLMFEWSRFMSTLSQGDVCTGLCFVFDVADENFKKIITEIAQQCDFRYPMLFVSNNCFKNTNGSVCQVILIDESNRIQSTENPIDDDAVTQFYRSAIDCSNNEIEDSKAFKQLKFSSKRIPMGVIHPGNPKQTQIDITNIGDSTVEILKITSSCDCTLAETQDRIINPGQTINIEITQRHDSTMGFFSRYVYLNFNNNHSPVNVELIGFMSNK